MKKIIVLLSAVVSILFISLTGKAQSEIAKLRSDHILKPADKPATSTLRESEVSIKAARRFLLTYPEAQDVRWNRHGKYYVVYFTDGTVRRKVVYNKDGAEDYSLSMYNQKDLDRRIYARVRSIYYDYEITSIQELTINSNVIHLVHLSGANYWKTIRISGNDFDEIESLAKK